MVKYGLIHCHTQGSNKDSVVKASDLVRTAKEMGSPAVTLTDHGVLTEVDEFMAAGEKMGINTIPGVEAYYETELKRAHLILLAKDYEGYQAISKAVTASWRNTDSQNMPIMTKQILEEYIRPHKGHIISTSACMVGVLASEFLHNHYLDRKINALRKKQSKYSSSYSKDYESEIAEKESELEELVLADEEVLKQKSSVDFDKRRQKANVLPADQREAELKKIEEMENIQKSVSEKHKEYVAKKKVIRSSITKIKSSYKEEKNLVDKYHQYEDDIRKINSEKISEREMFERATALAYYFLDLFGEGNFFIELQNHRIPEEIYVFPKLAELSKQTGIPVVAANDAHILKSGDEFKRQLIRSLRFNTWEELSESDKELYLKSDEELSSILSEIIDPETVDEAMRNVGVICDSCHVKFPKETHYPKYIGTEKPDVRLRRICDENIPVKYGSSWTPAHQERLDYELSVIDELGFSDYLCIVQDFLEYGRLISCIDFDDPPKGYIDDPYDLEFLKRYSKGKNNVGVGPGRGSAAGSIVCYLTGITNIDPIRYGLIFERFLNKERVSMPDIDSDFRPDIRSKVLDYVKHKYGKDAVCCIMTRGTFAAKGAIRAAARIYGSQKNEIYLDLADQMCKSLPNDPDVSFKDCLDTLNETYGDNADAMTIIKYAVAMEGVFVNVGMHAAGVILSDNGDVSDYVPLMYNKDKDQMVTECDKDLCESKGLLKFDFLGLINLKIINDTINMVRERIDINKIPFEPEVFKHIYSEGNTNSVFQFESNGMKNLLTRFKPETIDDIILLVAAYRPGPIQYIDDLIAVKSGKSKPEYVIPEMESVLGNTYGSPIYQEQIMEIFNKFAGFSLGESDIIRRLMSKKKTEKFLTYKDQFINGMVKHGGNISDVEDFWEQLVDFSSYAFNKSHAAAYATVSYWTAYLKYHYPAQYLCAVLRQTAFEKYAGLIADCKHLKVKVNAVDINRSEMNFTVQDGAIRYGFSNIKGLGTAAEPIVRERAANGPYKSFIDFLERCNIGVSIIEKLVQAGAFDSFSDNRKALLDNLPILKKQMDIKAKAHQKLIEHPGDTTKPAQMISAADEVINSLFIDIPEESVMDRLGMERILLGAYISENPADRISKPAKATYINSLTDRSDTIYGIISDVDFRKRNSDNRVYTTISVEDPTGAINVFVSVAVTAEYRHLLVQNLPVCITGKYDVKDDRFYAKSITELRFSAKPQKLYFVVEKWEHFISLKNAVNPYVCAGNEDERYQIFVYVKRNKKWYQIYMEYSKEVKKIRKFIPEKYLCDL